jgi:hypothetical protein
MRLPNLTGSNSSPGPRHSSGSITTLLDQFLPPDPKAPERPTIPPPTCGTLPPQLPLLGDLLGITRRRAP